MSLEVIEGTWEEIERRKSELIGRQLRVTIKPEAPANGKLSGATKKVTASISSTRISAMGKYAGILSSEDFMRQKQEEIDLEDRAL